MKLLTWNINHRVKEDPHRMAKGLISLNPDIIVLTEYRSGVSRKTVESQKIFLDELRSYGFLDPIISQGEGQNQGGQYTSAVPCIIFDIQQNIGDENNTQHYGSGGRGY